MDIMVENSVAPRIFAVRRLHFQTLDLPALNCWRATFPAQFCAPPNYTLGKSQGCKNTTTGGRMNTFLAELVGTMFLVLLGDGVVAAVVLSKSKAENSGWMVITTGWAMAVAMGVYVAGHISGGHINPAVTLALAVIGKFPWSDVPKYLAAQFLGAFLGAVIVWLAYLAHWPVTEDQGKKLVVFSTAPAIRKLPI